jgi:hypothetical protein
MNGLMFFMHTCSPFLFRPAPPQANLGVTTSSPCDTPSTVRTMADMVATLGRSSGELDWPEWIATFKGIPAQKRVGPILLIN